MAIAVSVPRLGWTMEEGTFVEWLKHDGERVQPGDALYVLESEKATENIEALDGGILRIAPDGPRPGDKVRVGQAIAFLVGEGEVGRDSVAAAAAEGRSTEAAPAAGPAVRRLARGLGVNLQQVAGSAPGGRVTEADVRKHGAGVDRRSAAVAATESRPTQSESRRRRSSPRARRVAGELGIDWHTLNGSGRNGRVRERDVRAAASTATPEDRLIPHTNVRRTIARRMVAGVTEAAPVTLTTKVDATNLVGLRNQFKATAGTDDVVPGYTDLIVKLAAIALGKHPLLQAQWREEGLFVPERIHIAVAVDLEAGLVAPVIRDVDRLSLREVAARLRELVALARAGRLTAEQMEGGTFTVTNLGMFGVDAFTPIITLPQCAVLGVGRIVREATVVGDQIAPRDQLTLSLTFDHRVVDGAPAARFLDALRGCIEQPAAWLLA